MVDADLPFGDRTAQMLMRVANDSRLSNPKHVSLLPNSWMTLYEITKLDDATFDGALAAGVRLAVICPVLRFWGSWSV